MLNLIKKLSNMKMKTEKGKWAVESLQDWILTLCNEFIEAEFHFVDSLFRDGRCLPGANADLFKQWVLFNAKDIVKFLNIDTNGKYVFPKQNPMSLLETWIDMSKNQPSPQEQDVGMYKVGVVRDDSEGVEFDLDF